MARQISTQLVDQFKSDRDRVRRMACLDPDEAAKITCELLVRYGSILTGAGGVARTTAAVAARTTARTAVGTAANGVRATPIQRQGVVARTIARISPMSRTISTNRLSLIDSNGRLLSIDSIRPGESFQALMLRDRSRIVLLRYDPARRNGGHMFIANSAYDLYPNSFPDIDPATHPGRGNIRFVVGRNGRWQADVGGRMLTGDNLEGAQEMANFLRENGIATRSVTGGRLPGWTRPAN